MKAGTDMAEKKTKTKYIFVTGGVVSSLGKGLAASSMGALLEARGIKVTFLKLDPYINVDPGTMSPFQHGEVFVTDDGAETDLDLGHYERYCNVPPARRATIRRGGSTTTSFPRNAGATTSAGPCRSCRISPMRSNGRSPTSPLTRTWSSWRSAAPSATSRVLPFLEAIRQMRYTLGKGNYLYIHLTLVPYIKAADELKTKPTQHSVKELQSIGIQPNILLCRSDRPLPREMKRKIALFCNVEENAVITAQDVDTIYEVPLHLHEEGLDDRIVEMLDLKAARGDLSVWETIVKRVKQPLKNVTIALVGKYVDLKESYKSLCEALTHGGIANDAKVSLCWVDSEEIEAKGRGSHAEGDGRHSRSRGIRHSRRGGKDRGREIRAGEQDPVFRHLPRHAVRRDRNRAEPCRSHRRQQLGIQRADASSGHLPHRTVV